LKYLIADWAVKRIGFEFTGERKQINLLLAKCSLSFVFIVKEPATNSVGSGEDAIIFSRYIYIYVELKFPDRKIIINFYYFLRTIK
jgi:hypothetical protein